jgi:hypothetical protein
LRGVCVSRQAAKRPRAALPLSTPRPEHVSSMYHSASVEHLLQLYEHAHMLAGFIVDIQASQ